MIRVAVPAFLGLLGVTAATGAEGAGCNVRKGLYDEWALSKKSLPPGSGKEALRASANRSVRSAGNARTARSKCWTISPQLSRNTTMAPAGTTLAALIVKADIGTSRRSIRVLRGIGDQLAVEVGQALGEFRPVQLDAAQIDRCGRD